jgi:HK97 family phage major capsid protein
MGNGEGMVNGYRAVVSNQVPSNLTKGTGTNLSAIIFGNWNDLIVGQWGTLDLMVDPYNQSTSGTVRVVALQDVDIAVRHPESFSAMVDAVTA